jgi:lipoprotein-releasing system permease protein
LSTEFFIAKKIIKKDSSKDAVSKPIVRISLASISIGVAVMLITISIVTGFQEKVREKVIGFGSHIQITKFEDNTSMESSPIYIQQDFIPELKNNPSIKHFQNYAYKPAILQTDFDTSIFNVNGIDTAVINRDILGVLFKGVDRTFDWTFFNDKLVEGHIIDSASNNNDIIISEYIANLLHYKVGDKINAYFVLKNNPKKRNFIITGIYNTGMEEYDKKLIFCQLNQIQNINNWGVKSYLRLKDTCINNQFVMEVLAYGSTNTFIYDWGNGYDSPTLKILNLDKKIINVDVLPTIKDFYGFSVSRDSLFNRSTAQLDITEPCNCSEELLKKHPIEYIGDSLIIAPFGTITIYNEPGTSHLYTGGFEVLLNNWEDLQKANSIIYENIPFEYHSQPITDLHPEIFAWLDFLDMNIAIILALMIIVSLINMTTSLLVLILEKTNMIGIFKAIGATDWSIRKIFLYNSLYLLIKGLFWGNLIALSLLSIQKYTEIIPLDSKVYYLDTVPVSLNLYHILGVNLLTIIVCMVILIIPSYLISKINPVKAIKFN